MRKSLGKNVQFTKIFLTILLSICDNSTPKRPFYVNFILPNSLQNYTKFATKFLNMGLTPPGLNNVKKNRRFGSGGRPLMKRQKLFGYFVWLSCPITLWFVTLVWYWNNKVALVTSDILVWHWNNKIEIADIGDDVPRLARSSTGYWNTCMPYITNFLSLP